MLSWSQLRYRGQTRSPCVRREQNFNLRQWMKVGQTACCGLEKIYTHLLISCDNNVREWSHRLKFKSRPMYHVIFFVIRVSQVKKASFWDSAGSQRVPSTPNTWVLAVICSSNTPFPLPQSLGARFISSLFNIYLSCRCAALPLKYKKP